MNVAAFNAQLRRMGQDVVWARASKCPCVDPTTGSPSPTCKVCRARSYLWADGVPARCGLSGMSVQREWAAFGQFMSGDVVVSVGSDQPLYAAGEMDRVLFIQSSESFDYIQCRGALQEFRLLAPSPVLLTRGEVSAAFVKPLPPGFSVITFDRCFWLTPARDAVIEGGLPVQALDGSLSWPDGGEPPEGVSYTLRGRRVPEYFVFGAFPRDRAHYGGQALPRRVTLRKWDLFGK